MNTCPTAVLFVVFKRSDTASRVFQRIRSARPPRLYIASDGPRNSVAGEQELVESIRKTLLASIDWPCQIETLFRETNLGCHGNMESAISWFFQHEEEGIILEDDCVPSADFFRFCSEMLGRYRHDERIMSITGNLFASFPNGTDSYCFSRFPFIWGWATWRRAWNLYAKVPEQWPQLAASGRLEQFCTRTGLRQLKRNFARQVATRKQGWDCQWQMASFCNQGLCIVPASNLVSNVGSDAGANMGSYDPFLNLPTDILYFPLAHPREVAHNEEMDRAISRHISPRTYLRTVRLMVLRWHWASVPLLLQAVQTVAGGILSHLPGFSRIPPRSAARLTLGYVAATVALMVGLLANVSLHHMASARATDSIYTRWNASLSPLDLIDREEDIEQIVNADDALSKDELPVDELAYPVPDWNDLDGDAWRHV